MSSPLASQSPATPSRTTLQTLDRMTAEGKPFACLTCYDATTARRLARAGVHVLLVGDTAAEVVLGMPRTIDMPLGVLLALTAGVKRGAPDAVVMGDMPFMSYQADEGEAIRNAGRFLTEGLADIVKLEVDSSYAALVEKMTRAGIPVCAHIGSRPQRAAMSGGYSAAGRTADDARAIVEDAAAMVRAGARMLLIEAVPEEVTLLVLQAVEREAEGRVTPVIGIGAGTACHGQVIVWQDLVGLTETPPRFAEPVADLGRAVEDAGRAWVERVANRTIGGRGYSMRPGESERLRAGTTQQGVPTYPHPSIAEQKRGGAR